MISIRQATPADAPLIFAFVRDLAEYEREPHSVITTEEQLLRDGFGEERYYECLIGEVDGAPAGFALFFPIYSTWQGRSIHLEDLFVRPAFRGHGIGKALLQRVAAVAVERNCARLQWDVLDWNTPAIDFYRSIGADMLDQWRRMRITGSALTTLADAPSPENRS
ncbi:MAG TPA: GNAT family N-acetyltransferase [Acidobacteriaceae bacterium]|nr:GNAT family N-acetyltransferase [Acidobacteriaceae bacterium]